MYPQPYLPKFKNLSYSIGALVTKDRPELCAAIGRCIAIWSHVDNEMGKLFGVLLGTDSAPALEVFLCLRRSSNQLEAMEAAAKFRLQKKELLAFNAVSVVYGSLEKQRNRLAHGCFGICPDDPEILFWVDTRSYVHLHVEHLSKESESPNELHRRLKEAIYVYHVSDLEALYQAMEEFWWVVFYFNGYLRDPTESGRVAEFEKLCCSPQIQQVMLNRKDQPT